MADELVRMDNINKYYGRVHALRDVNLKVTRGEVVGLLGDNGAGKSTLIKVLSGAVPITSGEIHVKGRKVDMHSTTDAINNGIVLIGVPGLAYNIFIGAIILGMMALHSWLERRHNAGT